MRADAQPATLLAAVQGCWRRALGERIAAQAWPVRERDGVITVECRAATWAQELDLMQDELSSGSTGRSASARVEGLRLSWAKLLTPSAHLMRDLQGFCIQSARRSGGRPWYPYGDLYPRPEPPGLGLLWARRSGFLVTANEGPNSSGN